MEIILALDPGITTGRALGIIGPEQLLVSCSQSEWTHLAAFRFFDKIVPTHLVVETFEYRNSPEMYRTKVELFPREIIGIARLYAEMYPTATKLYMQSAAQGKAFYSDEKLKRMDLYDRHSRHGRDALRHLLQWWTFGAGYQFNQNQTVILVPESSLLTNPTNVLQLSRKH